MFSQKESSALVPAGIVTVCFRVSVCVCPTPPSQASQKPECAWASFVITPGEVVQPTSPFSKSPFWIKSVPVGAGVGVGPAAEVGVGVAPGGAVIGAGVGVGPGAVGLKTME